MMGQAIDLGGGVDVNNIDYGARVVTTRENLKNSMTVEHVKNKG